MKKRTFALIAAFTLTLGLTMTASASAAEKKATITTKIDPAYTVTIPVNTKIAFQAASTKFGSVALAEAKLEPGYAVKVSAAPGELKNMKDGNQKIPYKLMAGKSEFTSAQYTKSGQSTALTLDITADSWNKAYAGNYEGVVTFQISYVANP